MTDVGKGIRSMTGFGRASFALEELGFEIEVRSVNHRHLDLRLKLPRLLSSYDAPLRARVQSALARGKVDLTVNLAGETATDSRLEIDEHVVGQYVAAARRISERFEIPGSLDLTSLMSMPGVARFVDPTVDDEALESALCEAVDEAVNAMIEMRCAEGQTLAQEFSKRLDHVIALVDSLESRSGLVKDAVRQRLRKRADQLELDTGMIDEARLHQEIVIAADRLDIAEELTRLRSHVDQFQKVLAKAGATHPVGRRLDFLLQELGREANTVGSKANDAQLAHDVVELKTELERIREQVQNVE